MLECLRATLPRFRKASRANSIAVEFAFPRRWLWSGWMMTSRTRSSSGISLVSVGQGCTAAKLPRS